ncbi:substrate-binding domain-containing protein [Scytonema hofmannii FACHB-248]|uniref:Substrate-binding domain-containing protein n=1 Tax=Scytonema hofmannii FACHB-248 TaxID=1842502 RepID=A0ABR8H290_9CYAN|nr:MULTISPECIES: substrate-binding domain-containing protein [Nostocales]MBD2609462.1 substrate-binding domain-containing protein [Scytonema hofmannii FACHB-248]
MIGFDDTRVRTILILAANPTGTSHLRLDREMRDIDDELKKTQHRHRFHIKQRGAVRYRDVQGALQETRPQIVHFAGHGEADNGLVFEDQNGKPRFVSADALVKLFQLCVDHVECVVLNACFSEVQARAIAQHIPYVIGMRWAIGDTAAQEFAVGFYRALGQGYSIKNAYEWGCNAIQLANISEEQTPVLVQSTDKVLPKLENTATNQGITTQNTATSEVKYKPGEQQPQFVPLTDQPIETSNASYSSPEQQIKLPVESVRQNTLAKILMVVAIVVGGVLVWWIFNNLLNPNTTSPPISNPVNGIEPIPEDKKIKSEDNTSSQVKLTFKNIRVPPGQFKYAGSTISAILICKPRSISNGGIYIEIQRAHPNFQLEYAPTEDGSAHSGKGIEMLINNKVDFVISSRVPTNEEDKQINGKGFRFKTVQVADYPLAIIVNSHIGVNSRGVTLEELDGIFAGDKNNWSDVEGAKQKITPYVHEAEKNAPYSYLRNRRKGQNAQNAPNTEYVKNTSEGLQKVAENLGGIYRAPAPLSFGEKRTSQGSSVSTTIKTIPIKLNNLETVLPYTDPNFKPLEKCKNLSSEKITPAPINSIYPEELKEQLYVIYKDYPNNENVQERAGKAYAQLLLTEEGQKLLEHIGFQRLPDSERSRQLRLMN